MFIVFCLLRTVCPFPQPIYWLCCWTVLLFIFLSSLYRLDTNALSSVQLLKHRLHPVGCLFFTQRFPLLHTFSWVPLLIVEHQSPSEKALACANILNHFLCCFPPNTFRVWRLKVLVEFCAGQGTGMQFYSSTWGYPVLYCSPVSI